MSTSSEQPPLVVSYNHSIPTLIPSICFFISFMTMSILHWVKFIKLKRTIHLYLFVFSLLRACLFASRISWSPNPDSAILGIVSNVLLSGGFFVIIEAICVLLSDWLLIMGRKRSPCSTLPGIEYHIINLIKFISPIFSIIGAVGEVFEFDIKSESHIALASSLLQASSLGFLCLIIIYVALVTHSALKYGESPIKKQLRALVLYILAALLFIELVYRTFVSFSHKSSPIYDYEWVFYVFECIPEIVILLILGGIILGEWFYSVEDDDELWMAEKLSQLQVKGKFNVNFIKKSNLQRGTTEGIETVKPGGNITELKQEEEEISQLNQVEEISQTDSQADSKTITININENNDDDKSTRTNNTNDTNSTNSPV